LLQKLEEITPYRTNLGALITIAIARVAQRIGWMVSEFYNQNGTKGSLDLSSSAFDDQHPAVQDAAKIPSHYYEHPQMRLNLISAGPSDFPEAEGKAVRTVWVE
jgi:hypothetical protein